MTPEEIDELRNWLRGFPFSGNMTIGQVSEAAEKCLQASVVIGSLRSTLDSRDTTIDKLESERACLIQELEHSQKRVADMLIQLGDLQQRHLTMIRELAKEKA